MIPTPEQLELLSRQREGDLEQTPFAVVLQALAVHQRTLVLEIRRNPLYKHIVFEDGVPVDCRSNLVHETLGRFLVTKGVLSEEDCQRTLNLAATREVPHGEVLQLEGVIDAFGLYRALQENLAKKLLDGFTWRNGSFRQLFDMPEVQSPLKVKVPQLVLTGIAKFALQDEVNNGVGPLVGKRLALHPAPPFPADELKLPAAQRRLLEALDQPRRLDELANASGLAFDDLTRVVYALGIIGVVAPEEAIPAGLKAAAKPKTAKAQEPTAPAAELPPAEAQALRDQVMQTFLTYRRQDAFDLLGLPEEANRDAIRQGYLAFAQRFAPWRLRGTSLEGMVDKAEDLFLAGAQAYGQLSDGEQRNALLYRRQQRRQELLKPKTAAADSFAIKTDLLDSEVQYRKGRALMDQGKLLEAVKLLQFASDCDPQNGVYRAELAYCRFLYSPAANAGESLKELQMTLRIDPSCGLARYYQGLILSERGKLEEAEAALRQAQQQMPGDSRPADALAEVSKHLKRRR